MKSIMISIKTKWCELIATREKIVEIRKTKPKCDVPFKCYIYCAERFAGASNAAVIHGWKGHVIGEFICDKIINVDCDSFAPFDKDTGEYIHDQCCLDRLELWNYTHGRCAFGWNITELKMYDKPKELSEFSRWCGDNPICDDCKYLMGEKGYEYDERECAYGGFKPLERPPQSWCYVEVKNDN